MHVNHVAWISTVLIQFILNVCYSHYFFLIVAGNEVFHHCNYILVHWANYRNLNIRAYGQVCCVAYSSNQGVKSQQVIHIDCVPCLFIYYYGGVPWECHCGLAAQLTAQLYVVDQVEIQCVDARCILLNQCIRDRLCIHTHFHLACTGSQWLAVLAALVCANSNYGVSTQIVVELQLQVFVSSVNTIQTYFVPTSWQLAEVVCLGVIQLYSSPATFWCLRNSIFLYYQVTLALHVHVASVILWQEFLEAFKQLFQLVDWQVLFQFVNHLLQVSCSKVFLALVEQHHCATAQIRDILTILLQQLLCFCIWDILAILVEQAHQLLIRYILLMRCQLLFQACDRDVLLIVLNHINDS